MVGVAQLAERLVVVQEVAGSTPVAHPITCIEGPVFVHSSAEARPSIFIGPSRGLLTLIWLHTDFDRKGQK